MIEDITLYACVYTGDSYQVCPLEEVMMVNAMRLYKGEKANGIVFYCSFDRNVAEYICKYVEKNNPWGHGNA